MKPFYCDCGRRVFFDNDSCLGCGRALGFDFTGLRLRALEPTSGDTFRSREGGLYRYCANRREFGHCNWLVPAGDAAALCASCRLNEIIPAVDHADNLKLWARVERAKRRLLYSIGKLGLPLARVDGGMPLRFRFLEDRRRNPDVREDFVAIAHEGGAVTINIAEADDAVRHAVREQMQERYRTVLGHLRHEAGHYYFAQLVASDAGLARCRAVFGDEREDYAAAMQGHYDAGPPPDWPERFISAYASAHPAEDFAETFAHFLHIDDALETAYTAGLSAARAGDATAGDGWIDDWVRLAITLNEILRSLGVDDPYPFVLTSPVREKLAFIGRLVYRRGSPAGG